jgi:hypothetical protein
MARAVNWSTIQVLLQVQFYLALSLDLEVLGATSFQLIKTPSSIITMLKINPSPSVTVNLVTMNIVRVLRADKVKSVGDPPHIVLHKVLDPLSQPPNSQRKQIPLGSKVCLLTVKVLHVSLEENVGAELLGIMLIWLILVNPFSYSFFSLVEFVFCFFKIIWMWIPTFNEILMARCCYTLAEM